MSKSTPLAAAIIVMSTCWAAPAQAEIYPGLQQWLDGFTDKTHKWVECPADSTKATTANPYFKFNPSTADPKFSCRQVGPHLLTSATWQGTENWWVQHARFLRVKPCLTYPTCSMENGECVKSMYCKVEAVRICTPALVGKPQDASPYGDGIGKNGCEMIWVEETEAQRPDLSNR